jgi:hypothetical protein
MTTRIGKSTTNGRKSARVGGARKAKARQAAKAKQAAKAVRWLASELGLNDRGMPVADGTSETAVDRRLAGGWPRPAGCLLAAACELWQQSRNATSPAVEEAYDAWAYAIRAELDDADAEIRRVKGEE